MERNRNVVWQGGHVRRSEREDMFSQSAMTLWLTGLSAAGKSTLAFALERHLIDSGHACYVLDGDNVRHGLNRNLGISEADRSENIRRVAEVARLMNDAGLIVISALISPTIADRNMARGIIGARDFREVFVSTPRVVCESRDPKGLYGRARSGELAHFTGVSAPYELPEAPDLVIDTARVELDAAVELMAALIKT